MSGARVFVDTNVLVYAHNRDEPVKQAIAKRRVAELWETEAGALSMQVLQELYTTITRKIPQPLSRPSARELVRTYGIWLRGPTELEHVLRAAELEELHRLSFWDALVVVAAGAAGAEVLLTEDLNHGQVIEGVRVENPFLAG
ncbi:MAG: PIN domain-containing protein [Deltaproteobacteria bacterium]|nr:PIN domain-containing protein [Deltaproteobacteria bacterium]